MELKTLLETQQWTNAGMDLTQLMISRSTRSTIDKNMKVVVANNYKALILNALFLCFFVFIYVFNPKIEFLIPTILIVSCFLFLIVGVWKGITSLNKIDYSQSLVMLLSTFLNTNKEVFRLQRQYHAMVLVQSFLGGFLLGLAFQGWTVEKALSKPAIGATSPDVSVPPPSISSRLP